MSRNSDNLETENSKAEVGSGSCLYPPAAGCWEQLRLYRPQKKGLKGKVTDGYIVGKKG